MKLTYCTLLIFILCSCAGDFKVNSLSEYSELKNKFTEDELTDLQMILNFYVQATCGADTLNKNKVVHCFMDQLHDFENSKHTGKLEVHIPFKKQLSLYKKLDSKTFEGLWQLIDNEKQNDGPVLKLRHDGIFIELMENLKKDYPRFNQHTASFAALKDVSPDMVSDILKNHQEYNLFDDRVRLFFTLHYLTFNDQMKRSQTK